MQTCTVVIQSSNKQVSKLTTYTVTIQSTANFSSLTLWEEATFIDPFKINFVNGVAYNSGNSMTISPEANEVELVLEQTYTSYNISEIKLFSVRLQPLQQCEAKYIFQKSQMTVTDFKFNDGTLVQQDNGSIIIEFQFQQIFDGFETNSLKINLPNDLGLSTSISYSVISGVDKCSENKTITKTSGDIEIQQLFKDTNFSIIVIDCKIQIDGILTPVSNKETGTGLISVFYKNALASEGTLDKIQVNFSEFQNSSQLEFIIDSNRKQVSLTNVNYTFKFTLQKIISNQGYIELTFPSDFTIAQTLSLPFDCLISGTNTQQSTGQCEFNGKILKISNFLVLDHTDLNNQITVEVQGNTNPPVTNYSGKFLVTTYYENNPASIVEQSKDSNTQPINFDLQASEITSCTIVMDDKTTGVQTDMIITFSLVDDIPSGGQIHFTLDTTLQTFQTISSSGCSANISYNTISKSLICNKINAGMVTFKMNLNSEIIPKDQGQITITISNQFINPRIAQTYSNGFYLRTYSDAGNVILNQKLSGIDIEIDTPKNFSSQPTFSIINPQNMAITDIDVFIFVDFKHEKDVEVKITLPNKLTHKFTGNKCGAINNGDSMPTTIDCSISGQTITYILQFNDSNGSLKKGNQLTLTIPNVQMSHNFEPVGFLYVKTQLSSFKMQEGSTSSEVYTSKAMELINVSAQADTNDFLGEETTWEIKMEFQEQVLNNPVLTFQITFPENFTNNQGIVSGSTSGLSIQSSSIIGGKDLNFVANNVKKIVKLRIRITNPTSINSSPFQISVDQGSYKVAELDTSNSSNIILYRPYCDQQCRDCDKTNNQPSVCFNCYSSSDNNIYDPVEQTCSSDCPIGKYKDTITKQCILCNPPCESCITDADTCTSCQPNKFYFQNKCVNNCGINQYSQDSQCYDCVSPCKTCSDNNDCNSCIESYYLYNESRCVSDCTTLPGMINEGLECVACSQGCSQCQNNKFFCTACIPEYYLHSNACIQECPNGYGIFEFTCKKCQSPCKTCSQLYTFCDTCIDNYFLLPDNRGECVDTCPEGFEPDESFLKCVKIEEEIEFEQNFESKAYFPCPITVLTIFLSISVYISKKQHINTQIVASLIGILSIMEYASWLVITILYYYDQELGTIKFSDTNYYTQTRTFMLLSIALLSHYLFNVIFVLVFCCSQGKDPQFKNWKSLYVIHGCVNLVVRFIGLITSFKFNRILYSRFFDYSSFRMKLENLNKFRPQNFISCFSIVFSSIPMVVAAVSISINDEKKEQMFMQALDTVILTLLLLILVIADNKKNLNFFQDQPENKQDQSFYANQSQNSSQLMPFNQSQLFNSHVGKESKESLLPYPYGQGTHMHKASNSEIPEFNEDNKIYEEEDEQFPLDKHTVPAKDETINQENTAPLMRYQEQSERSAPDKPRQFISKKKNPYPQYLQPIPEFD